ncbi:MAG TPA: GxxExxY protein [Pirellulales bacterium]|nr:GxxExxY protein [Pirellulales bacterium]
MNHEATKTRRRLRVESTLPPQTERIAEEVIDAVFKVHTALGPGLLENVYETCLCHELHCRGIPFVKQLSLPIVYRGIRLDAGLRLDLLIADVLIVEIKSVEAHNPLFEAQLLTYLKLTGHRLGLLINFNVSVIKDGIKRLVM